MKNVITVIVTYNRKDILKQSLDALINCSLDKNYILIVDNGSTDGTFQAIRDYLNDDLHFEYVRIDTNVGATNGFATGMKRALEIGCKYVWIMDDDCCVLPNSLDELLKADQKLDGKYGFLSSKVNWVDNNICVMNVQKINITKKIKNFNKTLQKIQFASFVSLFIKSEVIYDLGLPIREFYIWTDDWEYTRRISRKYNCYYISESTVVHNTKVNVGASITNLDADRLERSRYLYRNDVYLYRREGLKGWIFLYIRILYHFLKITFSSLKDKKYRKKLILDSIKVGKKFYPKIEYCFNSKKTKKVLILFAEPFAYGGQEAYMINMFSNYENTDVEYTFATPFKFTNEKLREIINKKNARIISCNYSFNKIFRKINIKRGLKKILRNQTFDVAHIQSSSCFGLACSAEKCKKNGIKKVIVHSHCGGVLSLKYKIIKKYSDKRLNKYADVYFACSKEAAKWKFPSEIYLENKYFIAQNGIDISKFSYDSIVRYNMRKKYVIGDNEIVFCHVGRFSPEKNHEFFFKLLPLIKSKFSNFKFIFIGAGDLKKDFIAKINKMGYTDYVYFFENIQNVNEFMFLSDYFLMPSLSEGLPMVLVEAQTAGLITIYSDLITDECLVTSRCYRVPLDENIWMLKITENLNDIKDTSYREKCSSVLKDALYDATECAHILEKKYFE